MITRCFRKQCNILYYIYFLASLGPFLIFIFYNVNAISLSFNSVLLSFLIVWCFVLKFIGTKLVVFKLGIYNI